MAAQTRVKVTLRKHCASDLDVINAARVSFDKHTKKIDKSGAGLIKFLIKNRHGTPFEHSYFQFHVEAPIFVFREWHRHRAGHSYNEMSGRYVQLKRKFHYPRARTQKGKPGSYKFESSSKVKAGLLKVALWPTYNACYCIYISLLKLGFAKEIARSVLPVATYSQMYWSCNARSLMHFLSLRNAPDAMEDIRDCAKQAETYFKDCMPVTYTNFVGNNRIAP